MTYEDLVYKESKLRECFKDKLEHLNVDGSNDMCTVKCVKTYGALWHYTRQLLMAETNTEVRSGSITAADTMNIQATGLKMTGGK